MKVISINTNGIRAAVKKGFNDYLKSSNADVICIQETKAQEDQIDKEYFKSIGYHSYWFSAQKKGYSGVGILTKEKPLRVAKGFGNEKFDKEGRVIGVQFENSTIFSVYTPSASNEERLKYKLEFLEAFHIYISKYKKAIHENIIITGDFNICYEDIDIWKISDKNQYGIQPPERQAIKEFYNIGFVDTFRKLYPKTNDIFSYFGYRTKDCRKLNKGWRIDYHFVSGDFVDRINSYDFLKKEEFSDHIPIELTLK